MFNILPNYSSQAALTQSGANLYTYITNTSGNLDSRLYQTGLNLGNRLFQTGFDLRALITAASNGVATLNSISGVIDIVGTGDITVTTNGQFIIISGNSGDFATKHFLTATGANLYNLISNYTGTVGLTGRGTNDYIPRFTSSGTGLINSVISQSGNNIAIGTAVANQTLTVGNTSNFQLLLGTSDSPISSFGYSIGRDRGGFGQLAFSGSQNNSNGYTFGGINGRRLTIYSDGNVGIGTGIPISKLDVSGHILALNITGQQFYGSLTGRHITGWNINALNSLTISGQSVVTGGPYYSNNNTSGFLTRNDIPYYHLQDYSSIDDALLSIGTGTLATLVISKSGNVTGNTTIPLNYNLFFTNSGCFTISSGKTLTIKGDIWSPENKKIFNNILSGQGVVSFDNNKAISKFLLPWWGPPNDYSSDAQPYIQAALNHIPNNSIIESPQTQNYLLASTLSMALKHGVVFRTSLGNEMGYTNFGLPFSSFKWTGAAGGTMLSMDRAYRCTVEGWTFLAGGISGADKIIDIDGYAPGQITSQNTIKDNVLFLSQRTGAQGISISETVTNNVEFMTLIHNNIRAGGYRTGYGVFMGASPNAHGHILKDNNFYELNHGIHMVAGNFQMEGLNNFGDNITDIWINDPTYPTTIRGANTESSSRFAYINGANDTVIVDSNRIQCFGTVGSGIIEFGPSARYVKVSNNDMVSASPGAYIYDCRNAQNLFLITENNRYPDTYVNDSVSGDTFIFKEPYRGNSKLVSTERGIINSQIKARGIKTNDIEYPPFIFEYVKSGEGTGITQLIGLINTPISGAMEWDGTDLYMTQHSGPTRRQLVYTTGVTGLTHFVNNLGITGRGTSNKIPKFTNATGLINSSIYESGGMVRISSDSLLPQETLDISGNFRMPMYRHFSMYRQLPYVSGSFYELGYFSLNATDAPNGGQGGELIFTAALQHDYAYEGGTTAKLYDFVKLYDDVSTNIWTEIRPRLSTGPRQGTIDSSDVHLEVSGAGTNNFYLRLRTTSGAGGGNCRFNIMCYDDYPFVQTYRSGIDIANVAQYRHTPMTQYAGKVGIGLSIPEYILHVSGDVGITNGGVYVSGRALITGIDTGSFITTSQTGQFYPYSNPQNYTTSGDIQSTGQQAWSAANNNGINLSGNLFTTGSTLNNKINSLSGYHSNNPSGYLVYSNIIAPKTGSYVFVPLTNDATANGNSLISSYAIAKNLTPFGNSLSSGNRVSVMLLPARYLIPSGQLIMDTDYVDLIGVGYQDDIRLESSGKTIVQTANNVILKNLFCYTTAPIVVALNGTDPAGYFPSADLSGTLIEDCKFRAQNPSTCMRTNIRYAGTYKRIIAEDNSFGGQGNGGFIGRAEDCYVGDESFAGHGIFGGYAKNCHAGINSFGGHINRVGVLENCSAQGFSFGGDGGSFFGQAFNCSGGESSFGGGGGICSGYLYNCIGDSFAFGGGDEGEFHGTGINCKGLFQTFGFGLNGINSGVLINTDLENVNADPTSVFLGEMRDSRIKVTGNSTNGINIGNMARIYNSTIIAGRSANSIVSAGPASGIIAYCITNRPFHSNILNLLNTGYNIIDPNITGGIFSPAGLSNNVYGISVTGFSFQTGYIKISGAGNVLVSTGINNSILISGGSTSLNESNYVHTTGNETVNGVKTFVQGLYAGNNTPTPGVLGLWSENSAQYITISTDSDSFLFDYGAFIPEITSNTISVLTSLKISGQSVITGFDSSILATVANLQSTGISLKNSINLLSGNLITTGQTLDNKIISLSGFVRNTSISVTGFSAQTGAINISGLGSVTVSTGIGNFIYISGSSMAGSSNNSDGINLSGNLTQTGITLNNKINSLSGWATGNFITTGNYYRPTQLYSGFNPILIDWSSGNVFKYMLTGHVSLSHTNTRDGQTVVVGVSNTGQSSFSGIWSTDIHWPNNTIPIQSTGAKMDIYTFIKITTGIYCTAVQGFGN